MPLIHSGTNAARDENIRTLMHDVGKSPHVQSREQALAIAYSNQRRNRADGGFDYFDVSDKSGLAPRTMIEDRTGQDPDAPDTDAIRSFMAAPQRNREWREAPRPDLSSDPMAVAIGYNKIGEGMNFGDVPLPQPRPKHRADGGGMPWYAKNEARSMAHVGPIRSAVPGRSDHIALNVPNGSYVLPAQHVSHLGQNNTEAGFAVLDRMFKTPHIAHGRLPPPPKLGVHFDTGGGVHYYRDAGGEVGFDQHGGRAKDGDDDTVPIMAAGGEFVVHPNDVADVGDGNLDHGHRILDEWVKRTKEAHAKTIAKLPGPAKD